jgi:hypothetical protein
MELRCRELASIPKELEELDSPLARAPIGDPAVVHVGQNNETERTKLAISSCALTVL